MVDIHEYQPLPKDEPIAIGKDSHGNLLYQLRDGTLITQETYRFRFPESLKPVDTFERKYRELLNQRHLPNFHRWKLSLMDVGGQAEIVFTLCQLDGPVQLVCEECRTLWCSHLEWLFQTTKASNGVLKAMINRFAHVPEADIALPFGKEMVTFSLSPYPDQALFTVFTVRAVFPDSVTLSDITLSGLLDPLNGDSLATIRGMFRDYLNGEIIMVKDCVSKSHFRVRKSTKITTEEDAVSWLRNDGKCDSCVAFAQVAAAADLIPGREPRFRDSTNQPVTAPPGIVPVPEAKAVTGDRDDFILPF